MNPYQFRNLCYGLHQAVAEDTFEDEKDQLGNEFRAIQIENFVSESGPDERVWAPRKRAYPHPPLRKTLRMFDAATLKGADGAEEIREPRSVTYKISDQVVPYAKWHKRGTKNKDGSVKMPARPFFYVRQVHFTRLAKPLRFGLIRILFTRARMAARS